MTTLRMVTWNVQGMAPRWRSRRAAMVGALRAARPDIVALQECAWRLRHQSMQLAGPLHMRARRAGTLGLISRFLVGSHTYPLPAKAKGGSKRALIADVAGIRVVVTHMPLDRQIHLRNAKRFIELAQASDRPFVVCGDMNERPGDPMLELFRQAGFADAWTGEHGETWPSDAPRGRIDFILTNGAIQATKTELLRPDPPASDHLGLLAELELASSHIV